MTKYKIISEPPERICIDSFQAEAFFEGTDDGKGEVIISSSGTKVPLDYCEVISDKEAKKEEEKWVLSEYG